ncbi:NACHT domain-containing protein [Methanolacinia petrolearia]|uniref:NACHT domain-containing protein n=1 Tax=Methanolacinia petrolearia TaxID=54120 RepID=UPI003BAAB518
MIGYEQSPLDIVKFEVFHLAPFNNGQVEEYAKKWFSIDTELNPEQQIQKAGLFLKESKIVPDLRSNPLMLALICNIYRGENYIPKNRVKVYEKCAEMLYSRWDKSRGIISSIEFEDYLESLISELAYWIYSREDLQSGVSEYELIKKSAEYPCEWIYGNEVKSRKSAKKFVEFCKGRAWIFTSVGISPEGIELFQFTHRTFLEYFTAANIANTQTTPEKNVILAL